MLRQPNPIAYRPDDDERNLLRTAEKRTGLKGASLIGFIVRQWAQSQGINGTEEPATSSRLPEAETAGAKS